MLDPASTVREGEFATAQNAASIPDMVRNIYNKALTGERLQPKQRADFKGQASSLYEQSKSEHDARAKQASSIARRYGIDPSEVVSDLGPEPRATMKFKTPGDVDKAVKAGRLKSGDEFIDGNGDLRTIP